MLAVPDTHSHTNTHTQTHTHIHTNTRISCKIGVRISWYCGLTNRITLHWIIFVWWKTENHLSPFKFTVSRGTCI